MRRSAGPFGALGFLGISCLVLGFGVAAPALAQNEQFLPMVHYRVGPYAAGGTGTFGGFIDYLDMLNRRDGGINGVKLTWEECETEYKNDRGVECYERLKKKGPTGASVFNFLSTGITYACLERATADKIPVVSIGYGRTDAADGRVFPYVFPLVTTYWSQSTAKIKFIGMKARLSGRKRSRSWICRPRSTASPSRTSKSLIPATSRSRSGSRSGRGSPTGSSCAVGG